MYSDLELVQKPKSRSGSSDNLKKVTTAIILACVLNGHNPSTPCALCMCSLLFLTMLGLENDVAHCPHMLGQGILIQDIFQKISLLPGLFLSLIRWICLPEVCDEHIIHNVSASGMILGLLVLSETLAIGHSILKAQFFAFFKPEVVAA